MCAINCSGGCPECSPEDHIDPPDTSRWKKLAIRHQDGLTTIVPDVLRFDVFGDAVLINRAQEGIRVFTKVEWITTLEGGRQ